MDTFGYRKLLAYQKAKLLVARVYFLMKKIPPEEKYAICDQMRRSAVSVTSNIAEGLSRYSSKDKIHFLEISYGSLMEVSSQMDVAADLGYVSPEELQNFDMLVEEVARLLSGLQRSFSAPPATSSPKPSDV